jgi:hypothetical protein
MFCLRSSHRSKENDKVPDAKFKVIMAVTVMIIVVSEFTPCSLANLSELFGGSYFLNFGQDLKQKQHVPTTH